MGSQHAPLPPFCTDPSTAAHSLFLNRILILSLLPAMLLNANCTLTSSSATCRENGPVSRQRAASREPQGRERAGERPLREDPNGRLEG